MPNYQAVAADKAAKVDYCPIRFHAGSADVSKPDQAASPEGDFAATVSGLSWAGR